MLLYALTLYCIIFSNRNNVYNLLNINGTLDWNIFFFFITPVLSVFYTRQTIVIIILYLLKQNKAKFKDLKISKDPKILRWKRKCMTEKIYHRKMKLFERSRCLGKNSSSKNDELIDKEIINVSNEEEKLKEAQIVGTNCTKEIIRLPEIETIHYQHSNAEDSEPDIDESTSENKIVEGRRIVELTELGKRLWCGTCKEVLSLSNIEKECRRGLGSMLLIRCHKCLTVNEVITSKMHAVNANKCALRFNINTDLALGILNTGISLNVVNKINNFLNLPTIGHKTYRKYQEEIGDEEVTAIKARHNQTSPVVDKDLIN